MKLNVTPDEIVLLLSSIAVMVAIYHHALHRGGWRASLYHFQHNLHSDDIILLALTIPEFLSVIYYLVLFFDIPGFNKDMWRDAVIRPSILTQNVILVIYFLNGRFTQFIRHGLSLWNKHSP